MRKIGKSICLSNGVIGHEVRKDYQVGGKLVPVMLHIAESLIEEEAERLRPWCDDKLVELKRIADGYCVFKGLDEVIGLWGWDEEGENEGNEEDEEESEDEEEAENETFVAGMRFQKRRQRLGYAQ